MDKGETKPVERVERKPAVAPVPDPYATDLAAQREANRKAYAESIKGQVLPPSVKGAG